MCRWTKKSFLGFDVDSYSITLTLTQKEKDKKIKMEEKFMQNFLEWMNQSID